LVSLRSSVPDLLLRYGRLLMALRDRNKMLSDVLFRQAFASLRRNGFHYDSAVVTLTNYAFSSQSKPFPDVSPADVALVIEYFMDAASTEAARWRGGGTGNSNEQALVASLYNFLNYRVLPIVTHNAPNRLTLLQSHIGELAQAITVDQRRQAEAFTAMAQQSHSFDGGESDLESRIQRAEREKNAATRDFLFRNLAIQMMRIDPEPALSISSKIDDYAFRDRVQGTNEASRTSSPSEPNYHPDRVPIGSFVTNFSIEEELDSRTVPNECSLHAECRLNKISCEHVCGRAGCYQTTVIQQHDVIGKACGQI
jgi:hypothetical protein